MDEPPLRTEHAQGHGHVAETPTRRERPREDLVTITETRPQTREYEHYDDRTYVERYAYDRNPPAHGLAVASLTFGVLGLIVLFGIGPLLALVFGYLGRARIKRLEWGGDGMAVAGIVLGWIGVFVAIGLLVAGTVYYEHLPFA